VSGSERPSTGAIEATLPATAPGSAAEDATALAVTPAPGTDATLPSDADAPITGSTVAAGTAAGAAATGGQVYGPGDVLLDDLEVERELGRGGMGQVLLVRARSTGERFALKRALAPTPVLRQALLAEIQTWIDLPEHPHLLGCRFVRTLGDEIVVFAEHAAGGSLADWIRDRPDAPLAERLDLAIQAAWGLDAAHRAGLIHQDVKPGNALLTADGTLKVADFGLARAAPGSGGGVVTVSGLTPAYCSPEQMILGQAGVGSDLWSWAVTLLELLVGHVAWRRGPEAPAWLAASPEGAAVPSPVRAVLGRCFREDPADRYASLADAAADLVRAHADVVGAPYPRPAPAETRLALAPLSAPERYARAGGWRTARRWDALVREATGRDPRRAAGVAGDAVRSARAGALAELQGYAAPVAVLEAAVLTRPELSGLLAAILADRAALHEAAEDPPGARTDYDRSVALLRAAGGTEPSGDLAASLASVLESRAALARQEGRFVEAGADLHEVLALRERAWEEDALALAAAWNQVAGLRFEEERFAGALTALHQVEASLGGNDGLLEALLRAAAAVSRGIVLRALGRPEEALRALDLGIAGLAPATEVAPCWPEQLANALRNRGLTLRTLGRAAEAIADHDRALAQYDALIAAHGSERFHLDRAATLADRAFALGTLGRHAEALTAFGPAIAVLEPAVIQGGRSDREGDLTRAGHHQRLSLAEVGDLQGTLARHEQAVRIRERGATGRGRADLSDDLALALAGLGNLQHRLGRQAEALAALDRAVTLRRALADDGHRGEQRAELAAVLSGRGLVHEALGDRAAARADQEAAVALVVALVEAGGRTDLEGDLAGTLVNLARSQDGVLARATLGRAVALLERPGRPDHARTLASARLNLGSAAIEAGDPASALVELGVAVALLEDRIAAAPTAGLREELARAGLDRAGAHGLAGDPAAQRADADAALGVLADGAPSSSPPAWLALQAMVRVQRASALEDLGDPDAAEAEAEPAHGILAPLVTAGHDDLRPDLAAALETQGRLRAARDDAAGADRAYAEAEAHLEARLARGADPAVAGDLARVLMNHSNLLTTSGPAPEHLELYERGVRLARPLAAGSPAGRARLAALLVNEACVVDDLGDSDRALGLLGEGLEHYATACAAQPVAAWQREWAIGLLNLGLILLARGEAPEAAEALAGSVDRYAELVDGQGQAHLAGELARSLRELARARASAGDAEGAAQALLQRVERLATWAAEDPALASACHEAIQTLGPLGAHDPCVALADRWLALLPPQDNQEAIQSRRAREQERSPPGSARPASDETGVPSAPALAPAPARSSCLSWRHDRRKSGQGQGQGLATCGQARRGASVAAGQGSGARTDWTRVHRK
jgi:tetratricopeptide (TPR) repeat protein